MGIRSDFHIHASQRASADRLDRIYLMEDRFVIGPVPWSPSTAADPDRADAAAESGSTRRRAVESGSVAGPGAIVADVSSAPSASGLGGYGQRPGQLIALSDGIFAIAMTLLVLNVSMPDGLDHADFARTLRHRCGRTWARTR